MIVERQYISADEFLGIVELPEYADRRLELVEGEIVDTPFSNPIHAGILISLSTTINVFVTKHSLGQVVGGDAPFVLEQSPVGRDTIRGIDIAYLSYDRFPGPLTTQPLRVAPDLAVEIVSPSNSASDIAKKIQQLLDAGTDLIWIVYPELRSVAVHSKSGATTLLEDDSLSGVDVLPGFVLPVREIFPRPIAAG